MRTSKRIADTRIRLHQLAVCCLLVLVLFTDSQWSRSLNPGLTPVLFEAVGALLFFIGLCLVGVAALGRMWCMLHIGGQKTSRLATEGPYSLSRNPLYFLSLLGAVGIGLCTRTFTIPLLIFLCVFPVYCAVIREEEANLAALHGDAYERYRRAVPKFFPRLSGFKEADEIKVNLKVYRAHIVYVLWFIIAAAALELRIGIARLPLW